MTAILFWMLLALQLQAQQAEGGSRDGTKDGMEHRFPAVRSFFCNNENHHHPEDLV